MEGKESVRDIMKQNERLCCKLITRRIYVAEFNGSTGAINITPKTVLPWRFVCKSSTVQSPEM